MNNFFLLSFLLHHLTKNENVKSHFSLSFPLSFRILRLHPRAVFLFHFFSPSFFTIPDSFHPIPPVHPITQLLPLSPIPKTHTCQDIPSRNRLLAGR